ncbi:MAG: 2-oxoacid:acceptor oxidoreductase subunit alpha [Candidatus Woesearchaeota archaeon]
MKQLITGNRAIVLGALKAGCRFYAGYPITPASEIMHDFAELGSGKSSIADLGKEKLTFIHAEDEIASAHMIIGASLAGCKAMTATSGPGFSLMQEAIGFGHMINTPIVIVDVQRVGPSTGMPTLCHQGDILQSAHGSHGDYYPIVFYPNSVEECYIYAIEAFNAAEKAQCPVVLLSDAFLARMYESIDLKDIKTKIASRVAKPFGSNNPSIHHTGLLSKNGIPKTVDSEYYREWIADYKKRVEKAASEFAFYEYVENKNADTLIIAYGITSRVVMDLKDKYSIFRPIRIYPVLDELKAIAKKYKHIVVVEMNNGQYVQEVERLLKRDVKFIPQLGGNISLDRIKAELKK